MKKQLSGYPSVDKPWLKYYSKESIEMSMPRCTVYEYLWRNNKDYPDETALVFFDRKITYKELFSNIDRTARAFAALLPMELHMTELNGNEKYHYLMILLIVYHLVEPLIYLFLLLLMILIFD